MSRCHGRQPYSGLANRDTQVGRTTEQRATNLEPDIDSSFMQVLERVDHVDTKGVTVEEE